LPPAAAPAPAPGRAAGAFLRLSLYPLAHPVARRPLYWLAFRIPPIPTHPPSRDFATGTPIGEAAFGYWLWMALAAAAAAYHCRGPCSFARDPAAPAPMRRQACSVCCCADAGGCCPAGCADDPVDRLVLGLPEAGAVVRGEAPRCFVPLHALSLCCAGPRHLGGFRACCWSGEGASEDGRSVPCCLAATAPRPSPGASRPAQGGVGPVAACRRELVSAPVAWTGRAASAWLHAFLLLHEVLYILSAASYAAVEQKDERNHSQTMLGLAVTLAATLVGHAFLCWARCLAAAAAAGPSSAVVLARSGWPARQALASPGRVTERRGSATLSHQELWEWQTQRAASWAAELGLGPRADQSAALASLDSVNAYGGSSSSVDDLLVRDAQSPHSGFGSAAWGIDEREGIGAMASPTSSSLLLAATGDRQSRVSDPVWAAASRPFLKGREVGPNVQGHGICGSCCHAPAALATPRRLAECTGSVPSQAPYRLPMYTAARDSLCARTSATLSWTVQGGLHAVLVTMCIGWYLTWAVGSIVIACLDSHPFGTWAGAKG